MNYKQLLRKIIKIIKKEGIDKYVANLDDIEIIEMETEEEFLQQCNKILKLYHKHSFIYANSMNAIEEVDKLPKMSYRNNVATIVFFTYGTQGRCESYIELVRSFVQRYINKSFILDFREDFGGNMWPKLFGLSPLLNNSTLFSWGDRWYNLVDDKIKLGDFIKASPRLKVAVLVGQETASSGEIVASCFKGRGKIFGEKTAGYLSVNTVKMLGNYRLVYTILLHKTRTGSTKEYLMPDVKTDTPIIDSKNWLKSLNY